MNRNKKTKEYVIDNRTYEFNSDKFAVLCSERSKLMKKKKTSTDFLLYLEDELNGEATSSTIKGWIYGINSPGTIDMVSNIASVFSLDEMDLLIEKAGNRKMNKMRDFVLDEKTREVVSDIYGRFIDIIDEYKNSNAFTEFLDPFIPEWECVNNLLRADYYVEWNQLRVELESLVKKSRPYLKKDVIQSLLSIWEEIFRYWLDFVDLYYGPGWDHWDRYFPENTIFCLDKEDELTEYKVFLNGREDRWEEHFMFMSYKKEYFLERLDEILIDYLP